MSNTKADKENTLPAVSVIVSAPGCDLVARAGRRLRCGHTVGRPQVSGGLGGYIVPRRCRSFRAPAVRGGRYGRA